MLTVAEKAQNLYDVLDLLFLESRPKIDDENMRALRAAIYTANEHRDDLGLTEDNVLLGWRLFEAARKGWLSIYMEAFQL